MKTSCLRFLSFFSILLAASALHAETLRGIVRNVNYGSHSFGLDVPPVTRVYVTGGTRFSTLQGKATFQDIKEGDSVEVEGRSGGPGVFTATSVKATGNLAPVKDLASNEINIELNQSFLIGVNQTAVVRDTSKPLKLQTTEFINTLCKGGYDCGGEGEVGMRIKVSQAGEENEIILTSKNHRKPTSPVKVQLFGYEIQLIEAGEDVVMLVVRRG
ncbi:hypothetical protein FBR05_04495 [Deltaproteobacteria bacterium PRO3]|nr:hypothetical protein [Deltaproteobacteria bacterium PRO3]